MYVSGDWGLEMEDGVGMTIAAIDVIYYCRLSLFLLLRSIIVKLCNVLVCMSLLCSVICCYCYYLVIY